MYDTTISSTLIPGYRQVETFDDGAEYEDEEVFYITLDLGNVEPTLVPRSSNYYLIGLDTPTPYLQLQGTVLKGSHDRLLGTGLVFSEDKHLHECQKLSVQHVANTEQRILFKEVTLEPKSPVSLVDGKPPTVQSKEVQDHDNQKIDRITGKVTAPSRAPRAKRKKKADGISQSTNRQDVHTSDAMDVVED